MSGDSGSGFFCLVAFVAGIVVAAKEIRDEKNKRQADIEQQRRAEEARQERQEKERLLELRAERKSRVRKVAKTGTDVCMECLAIEPKRCVCGNCVKCPTTYVYGCGHCSKCSSRCSGICGKCDSCCRGATCDD